MKTTAIYCRVSTIDQNPELQKKELIEYAKAMEYDFVLFEETESTRKTRPIKNKIFQDALAKKYDRIIVWKMDRWARSLQELINDLTLIRDNKVEFYSLKDNLKIDDSPMSKLTCHILGAFSEFERDMIRERTIAGMKVARAKGKPIGKRGPDKKQRRRRSGYLLRWANK